MSTRLTQKQETFCLKYFELGNATEAALIAGYRPRSVRSVASENLTKPDIQARINELRKTVEGASIASVEERKQILTEITRGRLTDFLADGEPELTKETPNAGAAAEFYKRHGFNKQGDPIVTKAIKLHNPIQAISELNKMERIYDIGSTVAIDNRVLTINVLSEKTKDLTQRLIEGERTSEGEGADNGE